MKTKSEWKVFGGANGEYLALERGDGFHHQPADNGARHGWERHAELIREAARRNSETDDED